MKRKIIALIGLIAIMFFWKMDIQVKASEQPNLQISVMSDVHINNKNPNGRFERALTDLRLIAPNYDVLAVVGDLTDNGLESDYQLFDSILQNHKNPTAEQLFSMGNHEYFESYKDKTSSVTDEMLQSRFIENTDDSLSSIYFDKWIKGYHFISLAGELSPKSLGSYQSSFPGAIDWAYISDEQYQWLEQTLAVDANSDKPIFVFLHQPINNTVYGSSRWGAGFDSERLLNILKKYPQAILFSGHSHYLLNHPKSIVQDGFTMVNTSSVEYTWYEAGYVPNLSQGYVVNVYNNRVELKAREFSNGTWIKSKTIPIPYTEAAADTAKPYFTGNSELAVTNTEMTTVALSWNQGQDDSVIDRYVIKEAGQVIQTVYPTFWQPQEKVSATITRLLPDSTHTYEVFALDAYDHLSSDSLKVTVTTKAPKGWFLKDQVWYYYTSEGVKLTGWFQENEKWYYFDSTGAMKTGWVLINGRWYDFSSTGVMKTGWVKEGNSWYFLEPNGAMKKGWLLNGNHWYYLDTNGAMKTGWLSSNHKWYYFSSTGAMKTGWMTLSNHWYYLKTDGTMAVNWNFIAGKWYYFSPGGIWEK